MSQNTNTDKKQFKLCLVGDGGVGKTKWCHQLLALTNTDQDVFGNGNRYVPTLGVEVHPINHRDVIFNVWDTVGMEKYAGLKDGYYIQSDCAMIMFTLDDPKSFEKALDYYKWLRRVIENKPIVFVGNKLDLRGSKHDEFGCEPETPEIPRGCDYVQLSAMSNDLWELVKPLDLLYAKLCKTNETTATNATSAYNCILS